jgi:nucleotide-binding universal stress UspA family protein
MNRPIIAHTTDLSGDDTLAFIHAAALAAGSGARLVTVHGNAPPDKASQIPDAAVLATLWGRAIEHERICHECCDDVADTVLDAIRQLSPAIVIAGTHARHGLAALLHGSVSEALARNLDMPTLVVPNQARGFVDRETGAIDLRRVLVPASDEATAEVGRRAARSLATLAGVAAPEVVVLHVAQGSVEDAVVEAARDQRACAIVMPTRGHDGLRDTLIGSHTERVIHDAGCPVLVVPLAGSPVTAR